MTDNTQIQEIAELNKNEETNNVKGDVQMYSVEEVEVMINSFCGEGEVYYAVDGDNIIVAAFDDFSVFKFNEYEYIYDYKFDKEKYTDKEYTSKLNFIMNDLESKHLNICRIVYRQHRDLFKYSYSLSKFTSAENIIGENGIAVNKFTDYSISFDIEEYDNYFNENLEQCDYQMIESQFHKFYNRKRVISYE